MRSTNKVPDANIRRPAGRVRLPLWAAGLLLVSILVLLVGSGVMLFRWMYNLSGDLNIISPGVSEAGEGGGASDPATHGNPDPTNEAPGGFSLEAFQPWPGRERVTILVLGIDQRCDETGPTRTDTIMLLTLDPVGRTAAALSLPRDLWVEIPNYGLDRINVAHYLGELNDYPGGGPALAMATVESFLGVRVDYYLTINFDAFVAIVDMLGGIEIDVPEAIEDPTYPDRCYGYEGFSIDAGRQLLDGQTALKYARTRATLEGDIDRADRQQAVVLAMRDKVLQLDMLPQLVRNFPELWQLLHEHVRTNLNEVEIIQLALLGREIASEDIRHEVIDYRYVYNETTVDGRDVLIPNRPAIRTLRDELFTAVIPPPPVIENLLQLMQAEGARVVVYNGTSTVGLAAATQAYLIEQSINVTAIGNADSAAYPSTQVIDFGDHPNTRLYLTQLLDIPPLNATTSAQPAADYDILIILGADWELPQNDS